MVSNPCVDALKHAGRDPALHGCFSALLADLPRCISADNAAGDSASREQPGISAVGNEYEQEQVCATGDGQRNDGGIDNGDRKQAEGAEAYEPMGKQRVACASGRNCGKDIHYKV